MISLAALPFWLHSEHETTPSVIRGVQTGSSHTSALGALLLLKICLSKLKSAKLLVQPKENTGLEFGDFGWSLGGGVLLLFGGGGLVWVFGLGIFL